MNLDLSKPEQECKASWTEQSEHGEHRSAHARSEFEREVLAGLGAKPKTLPCKYFYDTEGSRLFEEICKTPEYYVTRTEISILRSACPEVAQHIGPGADIVEPGSGAGEKICLLLDALDEPRAYVPVDISKSAVQAAATSLGRQYPALRVLPLVADFTQLFELPAALKENSLGRRVIFFPGSTISNFAPPEARHFLENLQHSLEAGDYLFIGVDRVKDRKTLEEAYDDKAGVTSAFNLNLLTRIQRELSTDLDPSAFTHRALYNERASRIEMHLVSRVDQKVRVGGETFDFQKGETIHTENSYKYTRSAFTHLAREAGFCLEQDFSDSGDLFTLYLFRKA